MQPEPLTSPGQGAKTTSQKWLAILLFIFLIVLYFGFYLVGIISPDLLAQPVINSIPFSFVAGAIIITTSVLITFLYAFFANRIDGKKGAQP